MLENIEKILISRHGLLATAVAGFVGNLADANGGGSKFYIAAILFAIILIWGYIDQRQKAKLYKDDMVPIPIVISIDDNTSNAILLERLIDEIEKSDSRFKNHKANLEKYFNITHEMLTFKYDGDMYDERRVISFLQIIRYELNDIQNRLKGKALFHLYYLKRPAFAIAIGGIFERDGVVIYQNNDSKNAIDRIATIIDTRQYKEILESFEHFDFIKSFKNSESKKLLIVIQISVHEIPQNNPDLVDFENVITLRSRLNGTIPPDKKSVDKGIWIEHAQEIYNIINEYKSDYPDLTIAHAMPEGVAILLGMGIANYWDVKVTQYDKGSYPTVVNLRHIEYYF